MGEVTYVRRLTSRRDLTYHAAHCRHVSGRKDADDVSVTEVRRALEIGGDGFPRRRWQDGREVAVHVCRVCIPVKATWVGS